jgi:1-acyl-sn-glycerol-3-phosphate acyltransferase
MKIIGFLRSASRSVAFLVFISMAIAWRLATMPWAPASRRRRAAAHWLQRTAQGCQWILGLGFKCIGPVPDSGLLVTNHLSYLDIIMLAALRPCVFVSKKEVRDWPIFGTCAQLGGTVFVDRSRRSDVADVSSQMRAALAEGLLIVLFPEGTSSGGAEVLPFKSALIEPALRLGCPVTAAAIGYFIKEGSVSEEICFWKDMSLLPHLLNVFAKPSIRAELRCGISRPRAGTRKALAVELHDETLALHAALFTTPDSARERERGVSAAKTVKESLPV